MNEISSDLGVERWAHERPDLDSSSPKVLARISRLAGAAEVDADKALNQFGLSGVEFHPLAAIRRAPDCPPSPRERLGPLMVSSAGLTNRIDRLEKAGLRERVANPRDGRSPLLRLTTRGRELVDHVMAVYLAHQHKVLDKALAADERQLLGDLLRKLLDSLAVTGECDDSTSAPGSGFSES